MSSSEGSLTTAIRGPILLIVVGGLFALSQTTSYGIRTTWPVLLIALGLLKLMDRIGGPKPPQG